MQEPMDPKRRRIVQALLATPAVLIAGRWMSIEQAVAETSRAAAEPAAAAVPETPECDDQDEPTPPETAGPFFKTRSPRRVSLLESGTEGQHIVLTGRVFSQDCRPLTGVLVDFWHADDSGEYDNEGYRLRGHQFTDAKGRYRLETIVPGVYPGRTRHFHVRLQAPKSRVLTTQLYFPDEPRNRRDFLFRPELLVDMKDAGDAKQARFHFKLDTA